MDFPKHSILCLCRNEPIYTYIKLAFQLIHLISLSFDRTFTLAEVDSNKINNFIKDFPTYKLCNIQHFINFTSLNVKSYSIMFFNFSIYLYHQHQRIYLRMWGCSVVRMRNTILREYRFNVFFV